MCNAMASGARYMLDGSWRDGLVPECLQSLVYCLNRNGHPVARAECREVGSGKFQSLISLADGRSLLVLPRPRRRSVSQISNLKSEIPSSEVPA